MRQTIKCCLVASSKGMYSSYVFKNLEEPDKSWDRYITVVECPN